MSTNDKRAVGVDDEFLVNTHSTGNHQHPDLAMNALGDFVVVWENGDGDVAFSSTADYTGLVVWTEVDADGDSLGAARRTRRRPERAIPIPPSTIGPWTSYTTAPRNSTSTGVAT